MKAAKTKTGAAPRHFSPAPLVLIVVLIVLFAKSFLPGYVHFSNDGPLGQQNARWQQLPAAFTGEWGDLNDIGANAGTYPLDVDALFHWALGPVGFAKFFPPIAIFILGLGAWTFFRQLKLSPLAAALGGLAAALNSTYFASACWGVGSQEIAYGMDFFALALIVSNTPETPALTRWARLALAGLCVGVNVMEGADIGALFSVFVAAFVVFRSLAAETGPALPKLARGVGRVVVIAVFAFFIAAQSVVSLVSTAITGVVGMSGNSETSQQHWDWATQWSLPKIETLGLVVPGLFGYKMDTPNNMLEFLQDAYQGGNYWGAVGRDPAWDRYFAGGEKEPSPNPQYQYFRFSGGGNYAGILVALIAAWAVAQAFRRQNSVFDPAQRRLIWFWAAALVLTLLLAWGRFAPFYALLYKLPYVSTSRNPIKFIAVFQMALVSIFACGVHALSRRYLEVPASNVKSSIARWQSWWRNAAGFDRKWTWGCLIAFAACALAWLIYASQKAALVHYLQAVGFSDKDMAGQIAGFSIGQAGWFLLFFAAAILLSLLIIAGIFSGPRAKLGGILLGALLVADLGRANLPWITYWNYIQKYDIDADHPGASTNPIINLLRDKPYEHRVALLPYFEPPPNMSLFQGVYQIEWVQHHFPYYNIQSLDIVQRPRVASDIATYDNALAFRGTRDTLYLIARHWELTNTKYILAATATHLPMGDVDTLSFLNQGLDPVRQRFREVERFDIVPKPGVVNPTQYSQLTALLDTNGPYALYDFTGALPRAKLYTRWELAQDDPAAIAELSTNRLDTNDEAALRSMGTNDFLTLKLLASPSFHPWQTVLLADTPAVPPPANVGATNASSATVEYTSYAPKDIKLHTQAATPTVLLLNDKYDPNWRVTVDGKPAPLLRANFIMRGVYLPAGEHTVEFQFSLPMRPFYVTLSAVVVGILLCGFLVVATRRRPVGPK